MAEAHTDSSNAEPQQAAQLVREEAVESALREELERFQEALRQQSEQHELGAEARAALNEINQQIAQINAKMALTDISGDMDALKADLQAIAAALSGPALSMMNPAALKAIISAAEGAVNAAHQGSSIANSEFKGEVQAEQYAAFYIESNSRLIEQMYFDYGASYEEFIMASDARAQLMRDTITALNSTEEGRAYFDKVQKEAQGNVNEAVDTFQANSTSEEYQTAMDNGVSRVIDQFVGANSAREKAILLNDPELAPAKEALFHMYLNDVETSKLLLEKVNEQLVAKGKKPLGAMPTEEMLKMMKEPDFESRKEAVMKKLENGEQLEGDEHKYALFSLAENAGKEIFEARVKELGTVQAVFKEAFINHGMSEEQAQQQLNIMQEKVPGLFMGDAEKREKATQEVLQFANAVYGQEMTLEELTQKSVSGEVDLDTLIKAQRDMERFAFESQQAQSMSLNSVSQTAATYDESLHVETQEELQDQLYLKLMSEGYSQSAARGLVSKHYATEYKTLEERTEQREAERLEQEETIQQTIADIPESMREAKERFEQNPLHASKADAANAMLYYRREAAAQRMYSGTENSEGEVTANLAERRMDELRLKQQNEIEERDHMMASGVDPAMANALAAAKKQGVTVQGKAAGITVAKDEPAAAPTPANENVAEAAKAAAEPANEAVTGGAEEAAPEEEKVASAAPASPQLTESQKKMGV